MRSMTVPAVRRPTATLVAAVLAGLLAAAVLLAAAAPAQAALDAAPGSAVLAAPAEPLGPEPAPRDAEDNPARVLGGYEDREVPFTWGAAWLLTFLGLGGLATMALVWFRAVDRPQRATARR